MSQNVATGEPLTVTQADLLPLRPWDRAISDPQHHSFARFVDGAWRTITATDHLAALLATARGLIASGVQADDRVALMSDTRYEWLLLDEAIWSAGAVTVPIYPSSSPAQVEWIVSDSGARILVVETAAQAEAVAALDLDAEVLVIDEGAVDELRGRGFDIADEEVETRRDGVTLDSIASLIYTSGTTGRPKGVVITHRHLASEVAALLAHPVGEAAGSGKRLLMFLPMAHVLARAVTYTAAQGGATVGFWSDFGSIVDKLGSFKPHLVLGVPRVFEKVHDGIRKKALHDGGPVIGEIFRRGERVALESSRAKGGDGLGDRRRPSARLRAEQALFDRLLFRRVREALGGECMYAISGGGALGERLGHFFRGVGVPIYEGYGLTESCAAITVNGPGCQRVGTVGRPIAGTEVRIADNGEIELRGAVVLDEYWRNEEATEAAFDDGWFRTGDLGSLDDDGYLTITGRAKEIIVTAGGKNVVPGPLEDVLRAHALVAKAMVVGEGRPFVGALITLDEEAVRHWAEEQGLADQTTRELCRGEELRGEIQQLVDEASSTVSRAEAVRRYRLLTDDFTEERDELTATHKLKRHVIEQTRSRAIEKIYRTR